MTVTEMGPVTVHAHRSFLFWRIPGCSGKLTTSEMSGQRPIVMRCLGTYRKAERARSSVGDTHRKSG